jgi:hypothetical protein
VKITTQHLEAVKGFLAKQSEQLAAQTKAAKAAEETRAKLDGEVRLLQGAYDVCAAAFASDAELSPAQIADQPQAVQQALGVAKPGPAVVAKESV